MTDTPAIEVEGLVKRFGGFTAVDGVSLTLQKGEIAGFLGPNGSGKTTTIRVICGLLTPDAGRGRVLGLDILRDRAAIKRQTGYMTQHFSYYGDLTVAENLELVARLHGLRPVERHVADIMADMGLTPRRDQLADTLSGGWKQRLALAASIMHRPRLLLLDEPTAGVDPRARRRFWDEIHALAEAGITILVSTHYTDEAERCHRINYILDGKLIAHGTVAEVMADAGLSTLVLSGAAQAVTAARDRLEGMPGVEQATHFGATLHVVGQDAARLRESARVVAADLGLSMAEDDASLEDVFIHLVGKGGA